MTVKRGDVVLARVPHQGKLISACPIIGGPLISSSEQSYDSPRSRPSTFTEENHGYLAAADSQVPTPPQRPTDQPLQTALTHRHRHDGHLCRHRQCQHLERYRYLRPPPQRL